ncbi:hypothetical protein GCK72_009321 [Caenorhabditis remanei]|uniref:Uncharacterized protein n=1 Tax=Caenorhabditis remanei TaxID=31234 RepID=A0A6A5H1E9_CAERE|nr:hypothetical protein GCK72_009321 [Caenorhabditis remanei]KAF1761067.1 hypothetical protein GCK72_009321 [Caenorhabditis remanei]
MTAYRSFSFARRTPVAPNGCPIERDPPQRLSLSIGTRPNFLDRFICSVQKYSLSIAFRLARTCPAKTSWISNTSISLSPSPVQSLLQSSTSMEHLLPYSCQALPFYLFSYNELAR